MYRIAYLSRATGPMTDAALETILQSSRKNNGKAGVGGMLVFADDTFFQVLEGPETRVQEVFDRVFMDPRHERVRIMGQRMVTERRFSDWSMGFARLAPGDAASSAFFELSKQSFLDKVPQGAADDLVSLLHGFAATKLVA